MLKIIISVNTAVICNQVSWIKASLFIHQFVFILGPRWNLVRRFKFILCGGEAMLSSGKIWSENIFPQTSDCCIQSRMYYLLFRMDGWITFTYLISCCRKFFSIKIFYNYCSLCYIKSTATTTTISPMSIAVSLEITQITHDFPTQWMLII